MTQKQADDYIAAMKKFTKELSLSKEKCQQFLDKTITPPSLK